MGNEHGQERQFGLPYEPAIEDREALAQTVREQLVKYKLDGFQTIVRFRNAHRYKVTVPHSEELLRHVTFEHRGSNNGLANLSALIDLPCPDPDGHFMGDPYTEIVDFKFRPKEWALPAEAVDEIMTAEHVDGGEAYRPRGVGGNAVSTNRAIIVATLTGVLFAGALAAEHIGGLISLTHKKLQDVYDSRVEPANPPLRPDVPYHPYHVPADHPFSGLQR